MEIKRLFAALFQHLHGPVNAAAIRWVSVLPIHKHLESRVYRSCRAFCQFAEVSSMPDLPSYVPDECQPQLFERLRVAESGSVDADAVPSYAAMHAVQAHLERQAIIDHVHVCDMKSLPSSAPEEEVVSLQAAATMESALQSLSTLSAVLESRRVTESTAHAIIEDVHTLEAHIVRLKAAVG